jgi:hypothetical protein
MPSFRIVSIIAVAMAVASACVTSVLSYLLASAGGSGCAGRDALNGYSGGMSDLWAFPLISFGVAAVVERTRRNPKTIALLERYDLAVFELGSFRFSYGMLIVYLVLFGFVAGNADVTWLFARRYMAMSFHCQSKGNLPLIVNQDVAFHGIIVGVE